MRDALLRRVLCVTLAAASLLIAPGYAGPKPKTTEIRVPELLLDGGRKLRFEGSLSSERDVGAKRKFFSKLLDWVAGAPDFHFLVRPYGVVTDSHSRIIVTDPGAQGIHIFDLAQHKYKFVQRRDKRHDPMLSPQCIALDAADNIYVTDSESGKIFVFASDGSFRHALGSLKGGEGYFKRPTGIAVDSPAQRIYVSDTWRNQIYVLDLQGNVVSSFGKLGSAPGEFNFPTELHLAGDTLLVVDAMNFRVQALDRSGHFKYSVGKIGDSPGQLFRPKGVAVDSEGHLYIVEGATAMVQVFDRGGELLYYFGEKGTGFGDFRLPAGVFIDAHDEVYVIDSYNARVQVFHYYGVAPSKAGPQ